MKIRPFSPNKKESNIFTKNKLIENFSKYKNMTKTFLQKKYWLLFFVLVACFTQVQLQSQDYVLFEDFGNGIPEDFVIYDVDGNTVDPNFEYVTQAWTAVNFSDVGGAPVIVSTSAYSPAGQADDWIGTPGIDIGSEGYTLSWRAGTATTNSDGYEVYVSTVSNELEDLQAGDVVYSVVSETPIDFAGDALPHYREVNLDAYAGETVFIAFRNNSNNELLLILDDIAVTAPPEGIDAILTSVTPGIEYAETPLPYAKPVGPFGAEVLNFSNAAISNVTLTVYVDSIDVDGNVINVWSASSEPITAIELSESQEIVIDETYLPTEMGFYAVSYEVTHDGADTEVNLDNNVSEFYTFSISDANYERDAYFLEVEDLEVYYYPFDDLEAGEVEQVGSFGTVYEFNNGFTEIDSVGIFVYQPIGPISCDIFEFNTATNQVGALVASTEVWEGSSPPGEAVYQTLALSAPLTLGEGAYFVAANDGADGNLNMVFLSYYQTPNRSFIKQGTGNWSAISDIPSINLIVTPSDIATSVSVDYDAEGLTYNFVGNSNGFIDSWSWDFGDGNTATGQEVSNTFVEGTYEVCVTGNLPDGSTLTECTTIDVSCALEVVINTSSSEASLAITEGLEPFSISWTNDAGVVFLTDETTATDLVEGVEYTVTVEDANGCINTQTFSTVVCALDVGEPAINPSSGAVSFAESTISGEPILYNWPDDFSADPTNSVVFDIEPGNYTMTIEDANGCSVEVSFTMTEDNSSIEDLGFVQSFSLAPNPASNNVTLNVDFNTTTEVSYEIYTIAGQRLMEKTIGQTNKIVETIDISTLSNGIYFVQLKMNDQVHIEKLVVNK